jgi:tubulin polyglutamylase TTLL6/13
MKPYQKINHFPAMYLIARKTFLGRNLKKLFKIFPEEYSFFPKTWIIPNEFNELKNYVYN